MPLYLLIDNRLSKPMIHGYDMNIGYNTFLICRYVYFKNNRIWYV